MKTSRRFLLGTLLVLMAVPVGLVAYSRVNGLGTVEQTEPRRTSDAELAALRDYTSVLVRGDFVLEIERSSDYRLSYEPVVEGNDFFIFNARVTNATLVIEGYPIQPGSESAHAECQKRYPRKQSHWEFARRPPGHPRP